MPNTHFVNARIWEPIGTLDRADRYENQLEETLGRLGLGEATGGGSQLDSENEIEFVDIELSLANLEDAVQSAEKMFAALEPILLAYPL